ncbi:MAG: M15 family metallopeptidase [Acidobacteriota bacterium]
MDYYVYTSSSLETPASIARKFSITEGQLRAANPDWKHRVFVDLAQGEEVTMPVGIENSPWFWIYYDSMSARSDNYFHRQTVYPRGWFPRLPNFGSPSSPLSALLTKLGNPTYTIKAPGTYHSPIVFTNNWDDANVSTVFIRQLKGVPFFSEGNTQRSSGSIKFYTKAHQALKNLFNAWEDDGLISKILTFEGSFNPRVIKSGSNPSNHSFGTAFDINGSWNGEAKPPAGIGQKGCLLELVPRANELGFYWGGFYKGNIDGMHFEYAKL